MTSTHAHPNAQLMQRMSDICDKISELEALVVPPQTRSTDQLVIFAAAKWKMREAISQVLQMQVQEDAQNDSK